MKKPKKMPTTMKKVHDRNDSRFGTNISPIGPQALTILIGVIAWCLTYLANTLPDAPLVEVAQVNTESGDKTDIEIKVSNLSHKLKIRDLQLGLSSRGNNRGKFFNHSLEASAPAAEGEHGRSYTRTNDETVMFEFSDIHPGQQFVLRATYTGSVMPELRLHSAKDPVYLLEPGAITWLVKWIVPVLYGVIMGSLALALAAYFLVRRSALANNTNHQK